LDVGSGNPACRGLSGGAAGSAASTPLTRLIMPPQFQPERRVLTRAGDLDRQHSSRPVFAEKWIGHFQEYGFETADRLRELRLHAQAAVKIHGFVAQAVCAREPDERSGYAERQC